MHAWEAVQKTLNRIEENIGEEISVEELAAEAALSVFYYQRLFTRLVKKPVREYIKLRRLARACAALRDKDSRILDVALDYGFGSHETFTRAFKSAYGIPPERYRKDPVPLMNFDKPDLLLNYVMADEGVPLISDGLVLEINRKTLAEPIFFVGVQGEFPFTKGKMMGEETGLDGGGAIWDRFFRVKDTLPLIPGGRKLGVSYHGGAPDGYTSYFAGGEAEQPSDISWTLPARAYVVCGFEMEDFEREMDAAMGKAMKYTRLWLRNRGLIADGFFPEIYYDNSPAYMELWIPYKKRAL